jgi:hypothetical protein
MIRQRIVATLPLENKIFLGRVIKSNGVAANLQLTVSGLAFGGRTKHHASTPTKACFEDKCFLVRRKKARASARQFVHAPNDNRQNPADARPGLCVGFLDGPSWRVGPTLCQDISR